MAARPPLGIRVLLAVAVTLGAGAALFWLWALRVDPSSLSQEHLHRLATTSEHAAMRPLPAQHPVAIEPIDGNDLGPLVAAHLPRPFGTGMGQVQGWYDTRARTIRLTGRLARASASSPIPALRGIFIHALRHEYGHAFLDDWLRRQTGGATQVAEFSEPSSLQSTNGLPPRLVPVVSEFQAQPSDIYGNPYATSNFNEYFAESYARFLAGNSVTPQMKKFLAENASER